MIRATSAVLRCDNVETDSRGERLCTSEFTHPGDFNATRNAAAATGWGRVRPREPLVVLDICPTCYPEMGR